MSPWRAPARGGYAGLGADGQPVERPETPPTTPATAPRPHGPLDEQIRSLLAEQASGERLEPFRISMPTGPSDDYAGRAVMDMVLDAAQTASRVARRLEDAAIRAALVRLGWTPPSHEPLPDDVASHLTRPTAEHGETTSTGRPVEKGPHDTPDLSANRCVTAHAYRHRETGAVSYGDPANWTDPDAWEPVLVLPLGAEAGR